MLYTCTKLAVSREKGRCVTQLGPEFRSGGDKEGVGLDEETGEGEQIRHRARIFHTPRPICLDEFAGGHMESAPSTTLNAPHDFIAAQLEDAVLLHGGPPVGLYHPGLEDSSDLSGGLPPE